MSRDKEVWQFGKTTSANLKIIAQGMANKNSSF